MVTYIRPGTFQYKAVPVLLIFLTGDCGSGKWSCGECRGKNTHELKTNGATLVNLQCLESMWQLQAIKRPLSICSPALWLPGSDSGRVKKKTFSPVCRNNGLSAFPGNTSQSLSLPGNGSLVSTKS